MFTDTPTIAPTGVEGGAVEKRMSEYERRRKELSIQFTLLRREFTLLRRELVLTKRLLNDLGDRFYDCECECDLAAEIHIGDCNRRMSEVSIQFDQLRRVLNDLGDRFPEVDEYE